MNSSAVSFIIVSLRSGIEQDYSNIYAPFKAKSRADGAASA
jgi:hypothetical protein